MDALFTQPINQYLSLILLIISIVFLVLCVVRFRAAYRLSGQYGASRWFIRGIRCLLISLTAAAWSAAFFFNQKWLIIIGLIIIAQEMYEGAMLSAALKMGE
nr:hypothetical protein [Desulfobacterales bacterium]